ncbi:alpha-galactosidase [Niabella soli]|uniref:Alpha-galactosidase n=1 Tax=Niabella soli DSM 19437 TaxID=929713 RepID=W0F779_9BACT|nr:alpha-galactosidase [Niabella soli]AHF17201.1 hypothetical protein NIASO_03590 [Niabella soli DSM 19437]
MYNKVSGKTVYFPGQEPEFRLPDRKFTGNISVNCSILANDASGIPPCLAVTLHNRYEDVEVKQVFRIFSETPAITTDYYLKYDGFLNSPAKDRGFTVAADSTGKGYSFFMPAWNKQLMVRAIKFEDKTDGTDNLVSEESLIPCNAPRRVLGNIILANDLITGFNFFLLKEAPLNNSQIGYPGFDFSISNRSVAVPFSGFSPGPFFQDWVKGYSITLGVANDAAENLIALRTYLKNSVKYDPERYDMILLNTWGDRNKGENIKRAFILKDLDAAAKLGVTHYQVDYGWQEGTSGLGINESAGNAESEMTYWGFHKKRFPGGFEEMVRAAKKNGIQLGLWFDPNKADSYKLWQTDAEIIHAIYKKYGIKYFKIDDVRLKDKLSEINFSHFLDEVKRLTNGNVLLNLDITADVRGGYFMYRNMGNIFIENRYTDFGNYYPFHTLRNLWMLARYYPPELLQVEFLNKWRNEVKYAQEDSFAPRNYSFDYLFAITMMAQPLAWFEASGLPPQAYSLSKLIEKYNAVKRQLHSGYIFPIGEMPDGRSWTGFQSCGAKDGFVLVFRELNGRSKASIRLFKPLGANVQFTRILGADDARMERDGAFIKVELPAENSFALFKYTLAQ